MNSHVSALGLLLQEQKPVGRRNTLLSSLECSRWPPGTLPAKWTWRHWVWEVVSPDSSRRHPDFGWFHSEDNIVENRPEHCRTRKHNFSVLKKQYFNLLSTRHQGDCLKWSEHSCVLMQVGYSFFFIGSDWSWERIYWWWQSHFWSLCAGGRPPWSCVSFPLIGCCSERSEQRCLCQERRTLSVLALWHTDVCASFTSVPLCGTFIEQFVWAWASLVPQMVKNPPVM